MSAPVSDHRELIDLDRIGGGHVVLAVSGGVDSCVTALLLKRAGVRVSALFMKNWSDPDPGHNCPWEDDVADALAVCEQLDIPLDTIDLSRTYWDEVFCDFLAEYARGRTPNPDVWCNREIKFKAFLAHARKLGGDFIATGHYARITSSPYGYELRKGQDDTKDQSYFLYALGQDSLASSLFPIGGLNKTTVRELAREAGLATHGKKDSTGICFIGERPFREFLSGYLPAQNGIIRSVTGQVLGAHSGVCFYTLGQREGLGIGGVRGAPDGPWFVIEKNLQNNELIVAQGHDHPALMKRRLSATDVTWVNPTPPPAIFHAAAKTRYRQTDQRCEIRILDNNALEVIFERPQRAITPGQSVVIYADDRCLGGGIIERAW